MLNFNIEKTACFTGPRPNKLSSYDESHPNNQYIKQRLREEIIHLYYHEGIINFISGMALGIDQWAAKIILEDIKPQFPDIKLIAAIPCKKQYETWPDESKKEWLKIIEKTDLTHYVSRLPYNGKCMQNRNKWMVLNSKFIIAVWSKAIGYGGTRNCINFAELTNKNIIYINPFPQNN